MWDDAKRLRNERQVVPNHAEEEIAFRAAQKMLRKAGQPFIDDFLRRMRAAGNPGAKGTGKNALHSLFLPRAWRGQYIAVSEYGSWTCFDASSRYMEVNYESLIILASSDERSQIPTDGKTPITLPDVATFTAYLSSQLLAIMNQNGVEP